jgi:hypothetical protein
MALLPYTKRVASVGRGPRRGPAVEETVDQVAEVEIEDQVTENLVEDTEEGEA